MDDVQLGARLRKCDGAAGWRSPTWSGRVASSRHRYSEPMNAASARSRWARLAKLVAIYELTLPEFLGEEEPATARTSQRKPEKPRVTALASR